MFYIADGYTEENVKFEWHPVKAVDLPELGLPQFTITKQPTSSKCDRNYGESKHAHFIYIYITLLKA